MFASGIGQISTVTTILLSPLSYPHGMCWGHHKNERAWAQYWEFATKTKNPEYGSAHKMCYLVGLKFETISPENDTEETVVTYLNKNSIQFFAENWNPLLPKSRECDMVFTFPLKPIRFHCDRLIQCFHVRQWQCYSVPRHSIMVQDYQKLAQKWAKPKNIQSYWYIWLVIQGSVRIGCRRANWKYWLFYFVFGSRFLHIAFIPHKGF